MSETTARYTVTWNEDVQKFRVFDTQDEVVIVDLHNKWVADNITADMNKL